MNSVNVNTYVATEATKTSHVGPRIGHLGILRAGESCTEGILKVEQRREVIITVSPDD